MELYLNDLEPFYLDLENQSMDLFNLLLVDFIENIYCTFIQIHISESQSNIGMSSFSLLRSFSSDTQSASSTPPPTKVRKMNKRFSFHQRQFQNIKEISETSFKKDKKSNLTRRWSSLKQYQATTSTAASSQQSLNTTGGGVSSNASSSFVNERHLVGANGEKIIETKKKWEVIEHYKDNVKGRETISSSLLAVSVNFFQNS